MIVDDTNAIINHSHYRTHDICKTVREMSPEQKQQLLDKIQLRKGVNNLANQPYDAETCEYIESLLNGKRPKNGLPK